MDRWWAAAWTLAVSLAAAGPGTAQSPAPATAGLPAPCATLDRFGPTDLSGGAETRLRFDELAGGTLAARTARRPSDDLAALSCAPAAGPVAAVPVRMRTTVNTAYADDRNNGMLWAGRGVSFGVGAGFALTVGPFRAALVPEIAFQQNAAFEIPPAFAPDLDELADPLTADIDLPQRFGRYAFWTLHPGSSYARLDLGGFAAGVSTENIWVGPAIRYPLIMSNTAPGFAHAFVGTSRPVDLFLFRLDVDVTLGRLVESEYFDFDGDNDVHRLLLWTAALEPRGLRGLTLGAARAHRITPGARIEVEDLVRGSGINLAGNELVSLFARWVLPESDAEVYAEWARDDRYATIQDDLLTEPDHSQAYMVGFQKVWPTGAHAWRVHAEVAHLQEQQELRPGRPLPLFYTNFEVRQGHTHRGQLLGASIGPGADAQFLAVDRLLPAGWAGAFVERVRRADASAPAVIARKVHPFPHDPELALGLRGAVVRGNLLVHTSLSIARRPRRSFVADDTNARLELDVTWRP